MNTVYFLALPLLVVFGSEALVSDVLLWLLAVGAAKLRNCLLGFSSGIGSSVALRFRVAGFVGSLIGGAFSFAWVVWVLGLVAFVVSGLALLETVGLGLAVALSSAIFPLVCGTDGLRAEDLG